MLARAEHFDSQRFAPKGEEILAPRRPSLVDARGLNEPLTNQRATTSLSTLALIGTR